MIACGNFSLTVALAKHFALLAANGTLLAVRRATQVTGLVRGLDRLLFGV